MRRSLPIKAAIAATLGLGFAFAPPSATAGPGRCNTSTAPLPFPAPDGTTFVVDYESGADASTLTSAVLDGELPDGCVVDGLGYSRTDGYLYALHAQSGDAPALIRIGRTSDGDLATAAVGRLPGAPLVADVDRSGRYVTFDFSPLTGVGTIKTYTPGLPVVLPEVTAARWDSSCDPLLNNLRAQARLRAKDPRLPAPETMFQDWAFNPGDGDLYGYASVDAHDAYLGKIEPTSRWKVAALPDQVIRISPTDGGARCAPVSNPHPPSGVDRGVIGDTYGSDATHGSAAVAGAAFTSSDELALFQLAQGQRWTLDIAGCFTQAGCVPEPDGSSPDGLGDAAGNPYQPARVTVRTIVGQAGAPAQRRQRFAFASEDLDPDGFALSPGESRTFDLAPGEVTLAKVPEVTGWRLEHTGCRGRGSDAAPATPDPAGPMRVVLGPGEQLICTYAAHMLAAAATPAPSPTSRKRAPGDHTETTALHKTSAERPSLTLPWNGQTIVSLPGTAGPLAVLGALLMLALGIGGGVFILLPKRRAKPTVPPYRPRHRA